MLNLLNLNLLAKPGVANLTSETSGARYGRRKSSVLLGLIAATGIAAAVIVTFFVVGGNDKLGMLISASTVHPHESTAEWVSDDAVGYASLNLRPGLSELLRARSFFENVVDFEEADEEVNDGIDELSEMFGMDLREVLPALGPEVAVAAYEENNFQDAEVIAFIGFLDMETGRSLVDSYIAAAAARGEEVETRDHDGAPLHVINDSDYFSDSVYVMVHPVEPYILIASSEDVLNRTLAMMAEPVSPLSEDPDFIGAMEQLPDNRFLSGYANFSGVAESGLVEDGPSISVSPLMGIMPFTASGRMVLAAAITVGGKDLRVDYVTSIDAEAYPSMTMPTDSLELIPADLIGFMNMGGLQSYIDQMLKMAEQAEAEETLFDAFKEETGLDLQADVLDLLGDEIAVALIDLEPSEPNSSDPFSSTPHVDALFLVEITDVPRMEATMERVRELAADSGIEFTAVDINGTQAWVAEMPKEPGMQLAFMFKDGFFIGSLSTESLDIARQVADGDLDSIRDNEAYERVSDILGDDSVMTLFVESEPVAQSVRNFIPAEDLAEFDERYAPWFEKIDAFAMTTKVDGEWVLTTGILTIN